MGNTSTVSAKSDFDPETAAEELRASMRGLGTDEERIIKVLSSHSNEQRQEIKSKYKQMYGEDVEDGLKSELGGDFEEVVLAMMATPREFDARGLKAAMQGGGTDEGTVIEIMTTRRNCEIEEIKEIYRTEFETELEDDLKSDLSGHFECLMVAQCNGAREENDFVDDDKAVEDAQAMYDAGEGQMGTDESVFNSVLCNRSLEQLRATFKQYEEISGKTMEEAIIDEATGSLEDGYLATVKFTKDPIKFFADRLYKSMKGGGTDDTTLIRIIVSRCELDLGDIKEKFNELYETSLNQFIEDDCGGDYKRMLLALVGEA